MWSVFPFLQVSQRFNARRTTRPSRLFRFIGFPSAERGYPPYHPRMMSKILVYGYCVGVFSSRRLRKRLQEDVAFRMLAAGNDPDFRTISDFRKIHLEALEGLLRQVLRIISEFRSRLSMNISPS